MRIDGSRCRALLLIDEELDAATPFEGSLEVRSRFPSSSLIALPGGTNHAFSLSGDACLDDQIAAYLATGTLPPRLPGRQPDALCDPLPKPVPTASSSTGQAAEAGGVATPALREWLRIQAGPMRLAG